MGWGIEKKPLSPVATRCRVGEWRRTTWPPRLRFQPLPLLPLRASVTSTDRSVERMITATTCDSRKAAGRYGSWRYAGRPAPRTQLAPRCPNQNLSRASRACRNTGASSLAGPCRTFTVAARNAGRHRSLTNAASSNAAAVYL